MKGESCWPSWSWTLWAVVVGMLAAGDPSRAETPAEPVALPSIAGKTAGMQKLDGYFNLYWDSRLGKLWLEIGQWEVPFLYQSGLATGVGSNDIGLDRGQLGTTRLVRFERVGPKVLLIQENTGYRGEGGNAEERRTVRESFAESTIWGFTVTAEGEGRVLVDATDFFLRDAHGMTETLKNAKQGSYRLEGTRSAIYLPRTKNFPLNTEVEATLTFIGDEAGGWVRQVTPAPEAITVREHHSLVQLPPPGYRPRVYDPRGSFFNISYMDYTVPIREPILQRYIVRYRLEKRDPNAAVSEAVKPIVYYLDRGAPEPIRTALLEGARWWNQAFEAAGFKDAFRVEMLPEGADPMDLRYNVIQWVHRATRGWSYGSVVTDPRTGEILKGHVTLGSLRVRQDFLIAEALLSPYEPGKGVSPKMEAMALARLRQLSAHEVGHTLGLEHNFAASTVDRASVMDYPAPYARLAADGSIDLSEAYATGIGRWDKVAIEFGYREFQAGADEAGELNRVLTNAMASGLRFLTDQDARPAGAASGVAHLWDNGSNPVDELERLMRVRAVALQRFGENAIREGRPLATLEDALVPLYLLHRYQVEAVSKLVGGMDYTYAVRGDGETPTRLIPPEEQRRALRAVLATVTPESLTLPENLLKQIPPRPPGYERGREHFKVRTGPTFDAFAPAEAAAHQSLRFLFNRERAARLVEFHARDAKYPGLEEVLESILTGTWKTPRRQGVGIQVASLVEETVLHELMTLASDLKASDAVRARAWDAVRGLREWIQAALKRPGANQDTAHYQYALREIEQFEKEPKPAEIPELPEAPDGPPIGDAY